MYKCSECGAEYKIKPKYCECGNNIFYETGKEVDDINDEDIDNLDDKTEEINPSPSRSRRYKPQTFSPLAIGAFTFCIVLAFVILFFIGNPKKATAKKSEQVSKPAQQINIPSIDSYWDNTPAAQNEQKPAPLQKTEQPVIIPNFVKQIIPQTQVQLAPKKIVRNTPAQTVKPTKSQPKPAVKTAAKKQVPKPKTTSIPAQSNAFSSFANKIKNQYSNNNSPKTTQNPVVNKPAPLPSKTTTQTSVAKVQTTPVVKHTTPPAKSSAQLRQELNSYKSGLRNAIGRKVDFTKVIGDGDCSLSFKVNSSGKLYSKSFTRQSSNITLNDAAFNALNTTTSYNPPPDGYKGETLRLNIRFYNGNFEISLQ